MPIYQYQSDDGDIIEIVMSMKEDKPEFLTKSDKTYKRLYSIPSITIDSKKPKTIGALAEKNMEKKVKSGEIKKKEVDKPWWRTKDKVDTSLARMTKKQKDKYIRTGKK